MKNSFIYLMLFYVNLSIGYGQGIDSSYVASFDTVSSWYYFKPGTNISASQISQIGVGLGFGSDFTFKLLRIDTDKITSGIHYRYYEFYKDVKVDNVQLYIHANSQGEPLSANGNLYKQITASTTPSISKTDAINSALIFCNDSEYFWQNDSLMADLKCRTKNPDTSYYPKPELVVRNFNDTTSNPIPNFVLAYHVEIMSSKPNNHYNLYIDATSGAVIANIRPRSEFVEKRLKGNKNQSANIKSKTTKNILENGGLFCHPSGCNAGNTCTLFYNNQTIYTDKINWCLDLCCDYRLKDVCTGTFLYVYYGAEYTGGDIRDLTNNFCDNNEEKDGGTSLWCLRNAYDYYLDSWGRHSIDNSFEQINMDVGYLGTDIDGDEFDSPNYIIIGSPDGTVCTSELATQDIIGHEYTHGVTYNTAGLASNNNEAGVLNESFSDIFGTLIEFWTYGHYSTGKTPNFYIGEDCTANPLGLRDMANPKLIGQPDTYGGTNWDPGYSDVHHDDGVQNYWFYLLCQGGSGTNDKGDQYCVDAIGMGAASEIAYETLVYYLHYGSGTTFLESRAASINAATALYGVGSNEVAQVTQAWYAVGVGPSYTGPIIINNLNVTNSQTIQYNCPIIYNSLSVASGGSLITSSNTEITILPNTTISNGSYFDAFIGPTICRGAAAPIKGNGNNNDTTTIPNEPTINIESNDSGSIGVIPNPNTGNFILYINIEPNKNSKNNDLIDNPGYYVYLYNSSGQLILKENTNNKTVHFDISACAKGIYMVRVIRNNKAYYKKIILE